MPNIRAVSFDTPSQGQQVYATEDDIARLRALAEALLKGSSGIQNIQSPWQGVAQMTQAAMGGLNQRAADRKEEARQQAMAQALRGMYGAGGDGAAAADPQAMATIMALDPRLGMQIEENRRAATRQAQQDAFARQRFEWEQRQAEREASAPLRASPGEVLIDPNTHQPIFTVPTAPKAPEPYTLAPGSTRFGPDNQPVASVPAASQQEGFTLSEGQTRFGADGKPMASVEARGFHPLTDPAERAAAGIPPDDESPYQVGPDGRVYAINGGGNNVTVNAGDTGYDRAIGTKDAEIFTGLNDEGIAANNALATLDAMEQAMKDPNFYSGAGAGIVQGLKQAYVALGGDPKASASIEAFNAQAARAALDSMGGSLGAGFSNADRDFVMGQVPNISNTPEGNRQLISINRAIAQRKVQIAHMARDYAARHGGRFDAGFWDELQPWVDANPLFPRVQGPDSGGGAPAGATGDLYEKYGLEPPDGR